ncbi:MAG: nucleotidyl transferase AbiEii/AbiGii toxin family protein [Proteobacteria bacterium]|nr:nucleotidyl transferase AbiEii/AbiGii toxin family protein [Pseudomonadota bacterium]
MNIESLKAKLLNISREEGIDLQELLNRFGSEQFLARLSASPYADRMVFKGGTLLTYILETERRTRDLDFSVMGIGNTLEDVLSLIDRILKIRLDDGIDWARPTGVSLDHPEMDYPGYRIKCPFMLCKSKGLVRMDFATGDVVKARKMHIERIRYKDEPLVGADFDILVYPLESIFSEKLHIAIKRAGANTRMKDYYDMYKLVLSEELDESLLKSSISDTFKKRETEIKTAIAFDAATMDLLQGYWAPFIRKTKIEDAPGNLKDVITVINTMLGNIYGRKR